MTDVSKKRLKKMTLTQIVSEHGKLQPQAVDLEEAVLGAILIESNCLDSVIIDFSGALFYKTANQTIADAIIEMYKKNIQIDILTVTEYLKTKGELETIGGAYYITQLTSRVASAIHIQKHIKTLQEKALGRQLLSVCSGTIKTVYDEDTDIFDLYAEHQRILEESVKSVLNFDVKTASSIFTSNIESNRRIAASGIKSGVLSGLVRLDRITSGWQKSDLIIVGGRPSMGKTAFVISSIIYPALELNIPIGAFSLEMSEAQFMGRIQSQLSEISVDRIIKQELTLSEIEIMEKRCEKLLTAPLYIDDTPAISLMELKSKCRRLVKDKGVRLIVIDYLQLMTSGMNFNIREQEISYISRGLKALAKELNIPIIAIAQLSRSVETRGGDKKPQLQDLRESGAIEMDADSVLFCYRPEYYHIDEYEIKGNQESTKGLFMLIIAKNRNGSVGEVPLMFTGRFAMISNNPYFDPPEIIEGNNNGFNANNGLLPNNSFEATMISQYEKIPETLDFDEMPF